MLHDYKVLDRGLVTAMRPRPAQKRAWGEPGIGKNTRGMYTIRNTTGIKGMGYCCEAELEEAYMDTNAG
jgi:hypothetical protein